MYIRQVTKYRQGIGCFLPPHGEKPCITIEEHVHEPPHEQEDRQHRTSAFAGDAGGEDDEAGGGGRSLAVTDGEVGLGRVRRKRRRGTRRTRRGERRLPRSGRRRRGGKHMRRLFRMRDGEDFPRGHGDPVGRFARVRVVGRRVHRSCLAHLLLKHRFRELERPDEFLLPLGRDAESVSQGHGDQVGP